MRLRMFDRNFDNVDMDNAGLISIGALFGWWMVHKMGVVVFSLPPWMGQFGISVLTMVVGAVVLHFVKRELKRRWPDPPSEEKKTAEVTTAL